MSTPDYIVGIGASAGGLEALDAFFQQMPPDSGLSFVVVQHLSPDYKSLMAELLSRHTEMPVQRAEDGETVAANQVYLIPPRKNLTLFHGKLILSEQDASRGVNLPIDVFLRSLAEDQGERAIAVILSGTGSDGTRGIRAIKEQGGMIMAQSADSAKFDGMPRSAAATGLPDFVLPPEEMPRLLQSFVQHPHSAKAEGPGVIVTDEDALTRIFALLREDSSIDFTFYKSSTVVRRIERRMTVNEIGELRDYARYLERHRDEVNTLRRELLIGVTSFFRDREVWEYLEQSVLPGLIENSGKGGLRFWVAGCSTGEEAYSLAIITREVMDRLGLTVDVKIFATDVDRNAVQNAGSGIYPESIVADLPPDLLAKYFQRQDEQFQIARRIREMVVFAPHDLLRDPPFTNIQLVSCRNLLIYLQPVLQKKVLDLFNFSLSPDGVLVLGNSETVGDAPDTYEPVDQKLRIFRTRGKRRLPANQESREHSMRTGPSPSGPSGRAARQEHEEERLLGRLVETLGEEILPLILVVSQDLELRHVVGNPEGYLHMPTGRVHHDITRLATADLATPLATGLQKVFKTGERTSYSNVHLRLREEKQVVELRMLPLPTHKGQTPLAAVVIRPQHQQASSSDEAVVYDLDQETQQRIADLEAELQFTRENLQATVEELETANEELQASNEELQASNEELQSTNEELQSVNEELHTVNAEYQSKISELYELNNDLDNLLSANGIASLFLDSQLRIRRYTPALTEVCQITDGDIGGHLAEVCRRLGAQDLPELACQVQRERQPAEREVHLGRGRWYLLTMHPYQVGSEYTSSVVMSLVDVTHLKDTQRALEASQLHFRRLFDEAPHIILLLDPQGRIRELNRTAHERLGSALEGLESPDLRELIPDPPDDEGGHQALESLLKGAPLSEGRIRLRIPDGTEIPAEASGVPEMVEGRVTGARIVLRDMRERAQTGDG
ncbi:chemotaxis protein CheB [Thioalkalivibrio sp. ALR17-21]|uniref:chemotaxis protein CheB n=1 Tax=Thioalkalivibrio sp. ALR17-21 TaxID=1269813 RepID=UPI000400F0E0|nr:chemotaxis protein CheB [Thioalkalivibrio sp. ALR17-21]